MTSPPEAVERVIGRIQTLYGCWKRDTPVARMREDWDRFLWSDALPASTMDFTIGACPARWIRAPHTSDARTLLYFHGGGYKVGSLVSHHDLMVRLSSAANCRVLGIGYRLFPEHPYPAALEDAVSAYRWALAQTPDPGHLALAGDSAGGGLAVATLLSVRARGVPMPASGVLLSALTDFAASGDSYLSRATSDPIHQRSLILGLARHYIGARADHRDPLVSPLYADLRGLPPLLLQVGDRETVLDDSRQLAVSAAGVGVETALEVWQGMIHVFQQFAAELPESRAAIERIGQFLRSHWGEW